MAHVIESTPDFAELRDWPWHWNQLTDGTLDGTRTGWENNCGPESLAECVFYITAGRFELKADEIHDQLMADNESRYTSIAELSQWCQWHGIEVEPLSGNASTLLQPKVRWAIANGKPIIVLFAANLDTLTGGHFCPVYAYNADGCWRANPWGGKSEFMTWAEFERAQLTGQALILHATRPPKEL